MSQHERLLAAVRCTRLSTEARLAMAEYDNTYRPELPPKECGELRATIALLERWSDAYAANDLPTARSLAGRVQALVAASVSQPFPFSRKEPVMNTTAQPVAEGTLAEEAVSYILQRVIQDRNFSYYMMLSEALRRCVLAEAERRGTEATAVEAWLYEQMELAEPRLKRQRSNVAEVELLRKRLEATYTLLDQHFSRGTLDKEAYAPLLDVLHRDPEKWPEAVR